MEPPKGFKRVEGFSIRWDCETQPTLEGKWGAVRTVTVPVGRKQEDRRCVDVAQANGVSLTVWESAGLSNAFDTIPEGADVIIHYLGLGEAKTGQNAPKLFQVFYK